MKLRHVMATAFLLSTLSSCSYLQKLSCNSDSAKKRGELDAAMGLADQPGIKSAGSCEGAEYNVAQYQNDYKVGFDLKKSQMCQASTASTFGKEDGTSGNTTRPQLAKLQFCKDSKQFTKIQDAYNAEFTTAFCSNDRATKLGTAEGTTSAAETFDAGFATCSPKSQKALKVAYTKSYQEAAVAAKKKQVEDFINTRSTANFSINKAPVTSQCKINADKSAATVEVSNKSPSEMLLKGDWKFEYYNDKFEKITEDNYREALLISSNNKKQFNKMTLPKNADFCRAEFMVAGELSPAVQATVIK
ncbi:MAG: hypothetical protein K2Q18_13675 [Bdellovibrionales bacterium]|nr:hypothetical protein [Bdellovibrionales bacterium]